jgi:hypothetical protein
MSTETGTERVVVRGGAFHDPIALMAVEEEARRLGGVEHVALGMADPLNLIVFRLRYGYDIPDENGPGPNDLVIAVRAADEAAADAAVAEIERRLAERRGLRAVVSVGPFEYVGDGGVERMEWPVAPLSDEPALAKLAARADAIARANDLAVRRMQDARPVIVGIGKAGELLPGLDERTFLHAGPPVDWADMCGPMRGAVVAAVIFEGLASNPDEAFERAARGDFEFAPGHERGALGPMAGVISHSMPVWIVENASAGNRAYVTLSEGPGGPFRFGAFADWVIDRLRWVDNVLARVLAAALERLPAPIDLRALNAQALEMGDEVHNRPVAGSSLFFRAILPAILETDEPSKDVVEIAHSMAHDDFFYLSLAMAGGKATADAAAGIDNSSIVTVMARNGTEFGLRMSGTGDRWFTAPSSRIQGVYLPGYTSEDANLDMGDSTITETTGLGGFAWGASPAISHFAGVAAEDVLRASLAMYEITWGESETYRIPALGYRGTPLGIDCRKVVETAIVPVADTGIAHREPGVGIIGGGVVRPPMEPFVAAVRALAEQA